MAHATDPHVINHAGEPLTYSTDLEKKHESLLIPVSAADLWPLSKIGGTRKDVILLCWNQQRTSRQQKCELFHWFGLPEQLRGCTWWLWITETVPEVAFSETLDCLQTGSHEWTCLLSVCVCRSDYVHSANTEQICKCGITQKWWWLLHSHIIHTLTSLLNAYVGLSEKTKTIKILQHLFFHLVCQNINTKFQFYKMFLKVISKE